MKVGDHIEMTTSHRNGADGLLLLAGRRGVIQSRYRDPTFHCMVYFPEDKLGKLIWDGETTEWVPFYKMCIVSPLILLAECAE